MFTLNGFERACEESEERVKERFARCPTNLYDYLVGLANDTNTLHMSKDQRQLVGFSFKYISATSRANIVHGQRRYIRVYIFHSGYWVAFTHSIHFLSRL